MQTTEIFDAIDSLDPTRYAELITETSVFRFGNSPPVVGKSDIREAQTSFFQSIKAMKHEVLRSWSPPGVIIAECKVTYTRHDGSTITLPVTDIFDIDDGKVASCLIFMDVNPLFETPTD